MKSLVLPLMPSPHLVRIKIDYAVEHRGDAVLIGFRRSLVR
jgi:hypothetical protein